jgi:hypothetical protein
MGMREKCEKVSAKQHLQELMQKNKEIDFSQAACSDLN